MTHSVERQHRTMTIGHVPDEASPLVQVVRGSEKTSGVHAIILRQPVSEGSVLEKLGLALDQVGERKPGVYVQITRPGEPFLSFRLAQRKFFLPLWFYLKVLDFFAPGGQYQQIRERAQREAASLKLLREPVSLGVVLGFYHHGKVRYIYPCDSSCGQDETLYIWVIADSKSPEGTEPDCWISSSAEKLEHQLATGPFQELAKHARAELSPWLSEQEAVAAPPAPAYHSLPPPAGAIEEGELGEEAGAAVDSGSALDTLERVCMEVALKLDKAQQQQQQQNLQQQQKPQQQQQSKKLDRSSLQLARPHNSNSQQQQQNQKQQQQVKHNQPKQQTPSRESGGSGSDKKRNHYVSSSSTASSTASYRSSSKARTTPPAQQRSNPGYYTHERYKDQPDPKRSRQ
jgi:hypothetical protein